MFGLTAEHLVGVAVPDGEAGRTAGACTLTVFDAETPFISISALALAQAEA
ncbi:MAG: hypothetical protein P8047_15410 [Gammaproteobacteria bacterium]